MRGLIRSDYVVPAVCWRPALTALRPPTCVAARHLLINNKNGEDILCLSDHSDTYKTHWPHHPRPGCKEVWRRTPRKARPPHNSGATINRIR